MFIKKIEWQIASKYLKSKRKESFISFISWFALIGIALGVAVLIIVMSVMNGFRKDIVDGIIGVSGHIVIRNPSNKIENYNDYITKIKYNPQITNVSPSIEEQVLLSSKTGSLGGLVYGLTYEDLISRNQLYKNLINTDLAEFNKAENVILIGRVVARELNLNKNDNITLISPNGYITLMGSIPKIATFKIIGIVNTGMYQYDSSLVILPFSVAQSFFNYGKSTQKIDLFIKNPQQAYNVKHKISNIIPQNVYIETWEDSNAYLINALKVEKNVMFLILSLVILIATFNIVSGLIMLVRSKTKEIAILKTMGLSSSSVVKIFLLIGIRIGFIGTFVGLVIGLLFSYNIEKIRKSLEYFLKANLFSEEVYFLSTLPSQVDILQVLIIIIIALFFVVISSVYPALRASSITPIEGLKYD